MWFLLFLILTSRKRKKEAGHELFICAIIQVSDNRCSTTFKITINGQKVRHHYLINKKSNCYHVCDIKHISGLLQGNKSTL